jgi:hypothetical protein
MVIAGYDGCDVKTDGSLTILRLFDAQPPSIQHFRRTIMTRISLLTSAVAVSLLSSGAFFASANAASNPHMQACSAQWQSMKTAGTTNGMKWTDFLKTCGAAQPASAPAAVQPAAAAPVVAAAPAAAPVVAAASPVTNILKKFSGSKAAPQAQPAAAPAAVVPVSATGGQAGEQTRIKACGAQWQSAKAANSVPAGQTWPQFWSACDTKMKAANG